MMKFFITLCIFSLSFNAFAFEGSEILGKETPLTQKERIAVEKAKQWIDGNNYPFRKGDTITYLYGNGQPIAICAPLQICLIKLGKGEKVSANGLHLGDSARWQVSPAIGANQTNLIIKPVDVGLTTTLVIVTDRRTYSIKLVSRLSDFTPVIDFHHPDDVAQEWLDYYQQLENNKKQLIADKSKAQLVILEAKKSAELAKEKQRLEDQARMLALKLAKDKLANQRRLQYEQQAAIEKEAATQKAAIAQRQRQQQAAIAQRQRQQQAAKQAQQAQQVKQKQQLPDGRNVLGLDFNYEIKKCKKCSWSPVRVYNDGVQTIIQMGASFANSQAPVLLLLGVSGEQLVNYRIKGKHYVVDQVFDVAVMVIGVGSNRQEVVISRVGV